MSFKIFCPNCGAPSSSSIGVCPYCKSSLGKKMKKDETPLVTKIKKDYTEGKVEKCLTEASFLYENKNSAKKSVSFLMLYLKILFESEADVSKIRSIISQVLLIDSKNTEVLDYLDILSARDELSEEINDRGEQILKSVIKRSPKNVYAHFFLGAHLFWIDRDYSQAVIHLEKVVSLRPAFVRAWGCLGALYRKLNNETLAKKAFSSAARLETNKEMKAFFKECAANI